MIYKIILLGPQGSGKGTQGKLIAEKLHLPLISMGALLRGEIANQTETGKQIEGLLRQGRLAPDELATEMLRRRLGATDARKGFILDGYPRNQAQAELLKRFVDPTYILFLRLSDHEAVKRMSGRLLCPRCGSNYHAVYNPPKHEQGAGVWLCDNDEAVLIVRDDDKPEAVQKRLDIYHKETEPVLEHYRKRGLLREVNAAQSIEKVHEDIMHALAIPS